MKTLKETIGLISYLSFFVTLLLRLGMCSSIILLVRHLGESLPELMWNAESGTCRQTAARGKERCLVTEQSSPAGIQRWRSKLNVGQLSNRALFNPKYRQDRSRLSWQHCQKATKISHNVKPCSDWGLWQICFPSDSSLTQSKTCNIHNKQHIQKDII